jgi:hypothetical protein
MLTLVNREKLIEAGRGTRLGAQWPGQRCLAKTRKGTRCQNPVVTDRNRCRMHGGKSTGPKTPEGKARIVAAHWKHGRRSRAFAETRKQIWKELRAIEARMRADGYI